MKCYEFDHARINNGLTVTSDEKFGKVVFLGINNVKSKALLISMDKNNPPVIKDGRMLEAWPRVVYTKKKTSFTVFQKPLRATSSINKKFMIRVMTSSADAEGMSNGSWRINTGEPEVIFTANGRRRLTRFCDDILVMSPGDSIIANLEGNPKEYTISNEDGKIKMAECTSEATECAPVKS
jgi:hypothetical protein